MASLYQLRNIQSVCPRCGARRDNETRFCSRCRSRQNSNNKRTRAVKVAKGECEVCPATRTKHRKFCDYHAEMHSGYHRNRRQRIKEDALEAYGGAICVCCGESGLWFLTLDHVNNDGHLQRKDAGMLYTSYTALHVKGYPQTPPLQVLCYNCNNGKRVNGGVCPHQENRLWKEHADERDVKTKYRVL